MPVEEQSQQYQWRTGRGSEGKTAAASCKDVAFAAVFFAFAAVFLRLAAVPGER